MAFLLSIDVKCFICHNFSHGLVFNAFLSLQHNPVIKCKDAHRSETGLMLFWDNEKDEVLGSLVLHQIASALGSLFI